MSESKSTIVEVSFAPGIRHVQTTTTDDDCGLVSVKWGAERNYEDDSTRQKPKLRRGVVLSLSNTVRAAVPTSELAEAEIAKHIAGVIESLGNQNCGYKVTLEAPCGTDPSKYREWANTLMNPSRTNITDTVEQLLIEEVPLPDGTDAYTFVDRDGIRTLYTYDVPHSAFILSERSGPMCGEIGFEDCRTTPGATVADGIAEIIRDLPQLHQAAEGDPRLTHFQLQIPVGISAADIDRIVDCAFLPFKSNPRPRNGVTKVTFEMRKMG
jgi:hypothetical protein